MDGILRKSSSMDFDPAHPISSRHATSSPLIPLISSPQSPSDSSSGTGSRDELDLMDALSDMQSFAGSSNSADNIYDRIANEIAAEPSPPPPIPQPRPRSSVVSSTESIFPPPLPPARPRGTSLLVLQRQNNRNSINDGESFDHPDGDTDGAPPPLPKKSARRANSHDHSPSNP